MAKIYNGSVLVVTIRSQWHSDGFAFPGGIICYQCVVNLIYLALFELVVEGAVCLRCARQDDQAASVFIETMDNHQRPEFRLEQAS
jgi:hypothetical protein